MIDGMKSTLIPFRVFMDRELHKKLKVKSVEMDTTMSDMVVKIIQDWLKDGEEPKKERFSLRGRARGGEPIPEEDIDEAIRELNKMGKQE
jgi:hypothetical protein